MQKSCFSYQKTSLLVLLHFEVIRKSLQINILHISHNQVFAVIECMAQIHLGQSSCLAEYLKTWKLSRHSQKNLYCSGRNGNCCSLLYLLF